MICFLLGQTFWFSGEFLPPHFCSTGHCSGLQLHPSNFKPCLKIHSPNVFPSLLYSFQWSQVGIIFNAWGLAVIAMRACEPLAADLLTAIHPELLISRGARNLNLCEIPNFLSIIIPTFSKILWAKANRSIGVIQSISVSSFCQGRDPFKTTKNKTKKPTKNKAVADCSKGELSPQPHFLL